MRIIFFWNLTSRHRWRKYRKWKVLGCWRTYKIFDNLHRFEWGKNNFLFRTLFRHEKKNERDHLLSKTASILQNVSKLTYMHYCDVAEQTLVAILYYNSLANLTFASLDFGVFACRFEKERKIHSNFRVRRNRFHLLAKLNRIYIIHCRISAGCLN